MLTCAHLIPASTVQGTLTQEFLGAGVGGDAAPFSGILRLPIEGMFIPTAPLF